MPRTFVAAALALSVTVGMAAQRPDPTRLRIPAATERAILDALEAYSQGDDFAVEKWLSAPPGSRTSAAQIDAILARDTTPWHRSKPMFILEVAVGQAGPFASRAASLLKTGAAIMTARPAPPGTDAAEDRFELLWYQAALGVAQELQQFWLQQDLLDVVRLRFGATLEPLIRETRLPLARAIAAGGLCCWERAPGNVIQWVPPSERRSVSWNDAIQLFADAAATPALHVEALVRGAVLLNKVGEHDAALTWFARVPPHDDAAIGYVQHFTHARLLDAAGRAEDAIATYRAALRFEPRSQTAAIGLAAALVRAGRTDEATAAAAAARTIGSEKAPAYDAAFRRADGRFVKQWLAELRRLRR